MTNEDANYSHVFSTAKNANPIFLIMKNKYLVIKLCNIKLSLQYVICKEIDAFNNTFVRNKIM